VDVAVNVIVVVLFLAMLAVAAYGWRQIPEEGRFRARMGATGIDGTMSKKTGLFVWPSLGLFVMLGTLATSVGWLGVAVMFWLFVFEVVSVNSTARD
jgi:hypothetical protein